MTRCGELLIALLFTSGCAVSPQPRENLPTYPLIDDRSLTAAMSAEFHSIHDVAAQGNLHLREANGDHVTLDIAMSLQPPSEARMQAWKFGQSVFDLTVTPIGAWLLSGDPHAAKLQVTGAQLSRSMGLLSGEFLDEPALTLSDQGDWLLLTRHDAGKPTIRCMIDRETRTIRKYELFDNVGIVRLSLSQSQFVDHHGIVWPNHLVAVSDRGTIDITLHDVDINSGLPTGAFVPPRRATRLP